MRTFTLAELKIAMDRAAIAPHHFDNTVSELNRLPETPPLPPMNDDLIEILGRPNFGCIQFAQRLRRLGTDIQTKAEHEQAHVIHMMLSMYLKHGDGWRDAVLDALKVA